MSPSQFFKCLADDTRLHCLLLIHHAGELCVCDLTQVLELSQPKVSRHLAVLRQCGLLADRREGKWVYYSLQPSLAPWMLEVFNTTLAAARQSSPVIKPLISKLAKCHNRACQA